MKFDDDIKVYYHGESWSDSDYREARRGTWAVDRQRFQRRIREVSAVLEPVLTDSHRLVIRLRNMLLTEL